MKIAPPANPPRLATPKRATVNQVIQHRATPKSVLASGPRKADLTAGVRAVDAQVVATASEAADAPVSGITTARAPSATQVAETQSVETRAVAMWRDATAKAPLAAAKSSTPRLGPLKARSTPVTTWWTTTLSPT